MSMRINVILFCKDFIKYHIILSSIAGLITGIVHARQIVPNAVRSYTPGYNISRKDLMTTYVLFSSYVAGWAIYECCTYPYVRAYNFINKIGLYLA